MIRLKPRVWRNWEVLYYATNYYCDRTYPVYGWVARTLFWIVLLPAKAVTNPLSMRVNLVIHQPCWSAARWRSIT